MYAFSSFYYHSTVCTSPKIGAVRSCTQEAQGPGAAETPKIESTSWLSRPKVLASLRLSHSPSSGGSAGELVTRNSPYMQPLFTLQWPRASNSGKMYLSCDNLESEHWDRGHQRWMTVEVILRRSISSSPLLTEFNDRVQGCTALTTHSRFCRMAISRVHVAICDDNPGPRVCLQVGASMHQALRMFNMSMVAHLNRGVTRLLGASCQTPHLTYLNPFYCLCLLYS